MEDFKVIKCQSCGSSMVELKGDNIAKCSHCGSVLTHQNSNKKLQGILYIVVAMLVFIGGGLFWIINNQSSNAEKAEIAVEKVIDIPTYQAPIASIPKLTSNSVVITNEEVKAYQEKISTPQIDIVSKIQGQTSIGGLFWIVTIQNESLYTVTRPGLVMSLFDEHNNRIDELRVWSKLAFLKSGQSTDVLVNLSKPPKIKFSTEINGMAKVATDYDRPQETIEVKSFVVNGSGKRVEIVGDVYNDNDFQVDFVEIIAVAKDSEGQSIGIANSYASITNMPAMSQSGFKIKTGTFIAKDPSSWRLWAIGRKHRN